MVAPQPHPHLHLPLVCSSHAHPNGHCDTLHRDFFGGLCLILITCRNLLIFISFRFASASESASASPSPSTSGSVPPSPSATPSASASPSQSECMPIASLCLGCGRAFIHCPLEAGFKWLFRSYSWELCMRRLVRHVMCGAVTWKHVACECQNPGRQHAHTRDWLRYMWIPKKGEGWPYHAEDDPGPCQKKPVSQAKGFLTPSHAIRPHTTMLLAN